MGRTGSVESVTIYDVADHAGVSIKTVSRVLNREANVRAQTREQVIAAVAALNYRPNVSARSLAGARSYLIGLLFDNPSASYMSDVQLGATARCRSQGYHLLVEPIESGQAEGRAAVADLLTTLRLDGLILTPPVCDRPDLLDLLDQQGVPYVRIAPNSALERGARIQMDDRAAAHAMTSRLLALGHREIGFIRGHPDHGASQLRYEGHLAAMADHGLPVEDSRVQQGYFSYRSGVEAAERLLEEGELTAIFASNDDMAVGAMTAAAKRGLDVPTQLSVAGFDDTPTAKVVWPALTTVRQPVGEMAAMAADLLIARELQDDDGRPTIRQLDFEVVERESTAGPRR